MSCLKENVWPEKGRGGELSCINHCLRKLGDGYKAVYYIKWFFLPLCIHESFHNKKFSFKRSREEGGGIVLLLKRKLPGVRILTPGQINKLQLCLVMIPRVLENVQTFQF